MELTKDVFELIFPQGVFEWFDLKESGKDEQTVHLTFEEKDLPPLLATDKNKRIIARKFHEITVIDFPLRGKQTLLTFRRRYWKLEGRPEYLKRDIQLTFPGTQLEKKFADFLKKDGGN